MDDKLNPELLIDALDQQAVDELDPEQTKMLRLEVEKMLESERGPKPIIDWHPFPNSPQEAAYFCQADELYFGGGGGGGKMLCLETPIPTPYGWTTVGAISAGDSLFSADGSVCHVTAVHPIDLTPKSYRLHFDDGSSIDCCAEHLWLTFDMGELKLLTRGTEEWRAKRRERRASRSCVGAGLGKSFSIEHRTVLSEARTAWNKSHRPLIKRPPSGTVRSTQQIVDTLRVRGRTNHAVPVAKPLNCNGQDLPIDPYLFGCWLGDGTSANGSITTADAEILLAFKDQFASGFISQKEGSKSATYGFLGLKRLLRQLGVLRNKHIPSVYLRASIEQRLALLQGLMDTDGYCKPSGGVVFLVVNERLATDTHELILSLGDKARMVVGRAKLRGLDCGPCYKITWTSQHKVFRLPRKLERQSSRIKKRRTTEFRYIVDAEEIPPKPMRCLTVDSSSGLFLVGRDMIPTHNTELVIGLALTSHRRSLILRRTFPQLRGIIERVRALVPPEKGAYNAQDHIMRMGDGRILELGSVLLESDKQSFQGREHDLKCVGRGTLVRMKSGYKKIEDVRVGDYVATLSGPKKVTRVLNMGVKKCVKITTNKYSQIQSCGHKILTSHGWLSADMFCEFRPCATCESTARCAAGKFAKSKQQKCVILSPDVLGLLLGRQRQQESFECRADYRYTQDLRAGTVSLNQETGSVKSNGCTQEGARLALCRRQQQAQIELARQKSSFYSWPSFYAYDVCDARSLTLPANYQEHCLLDSHLDDEHARPAEVFVRLCPLRQGGAADTSPKGFASGGQEEIQIHSRCIERYAHPYTMEMCQTEADTRFSAFSISYAGEQQVFDLTVESANHYITGDCGIVNKNCFDELPQFPRSVYRFIIGWNRTSDPGQRCRVVGAGNPPLNPEDRWVIEEWAPWLDEHYHNPAVPGELRWYTILDSKLVWVDGGQPFRHKGELIVPRSRTFIPSRVDDNPILMSRGYKSVLQGMPEPLRSQLLYGDMSAGTQDNPFQIIPTRWVREAMARWEPNGCGDEPLTAVGVDPARGGEDKAVLANRHRVWWDKLDKHPGGEVPDGQTLVNLIKRNLDMQPNPDSHNPEINIDVIGIGSSAYDIMRFFDMRANAVNVANSTLLRDSSGALIFRNIRAWLYWRMRDVLDPNNPLDLPCPPQLPDDPELLSDLCAVRYKNTPGGIVAEKKEDIQERIGRSPDCGDAVVLSLFQGMSDWQIRFVG